RRRILLPTPRWRGLVTVRNSTRRTDPTSRPTAPGRRLAPTLRRLPDSPANRRRSMPTYKAPVDDVLFLLNDVFRIERYNNLPGFAEASPDIVEAVLTEAAKFCEQVLLPL